MTAKIITAEYVADLCRRIEEGELPKKNTEISAKEFVRQMVPHVKIFLAKGYTYKEIAVFFGHVSVTDLKKAVAKEAAATPPEKSEKEYPEKAVSAKPSGKGKQAKKARPGQ
ncbi:MAG: hypothetical protein LBB60_00340 [Desulfovibrio sp.]|jgi:cysteinyl-tRNA synthetase|nr:hypothetical protein [Desulfovibrio sp.]